MAKRDCTCDRLAEVWAYDDGKILRPLSALGEDETAHAFVDADDFAGDGAEEAVFWLTGYNKDGFIFYYDNFSHSVWYSWSYQRHFGAEKMSRDDFLQRS